MANPNPNPSTRFQKGDQRINRKGRPKTFDAFRELAQRVSHEAVPLKDKSGQPTGEYMTVVEARLRQWAQSKDPRLQIAFIEIAYGKVPQRQELTGKDGTPIEVIHVKPRSDDD